MFAHLVLMLACSDFPAILEFLNDLSGAIAHFANQYSNVIKQKNAFNKGQK